MITNSLTCQETTQRGAEGEDALSFYFSIWLLLIQESPPVLNISFLLMIPMKIAGFCPMSSSSFISSVSLFGLLVKSFSSLSPFYLKHLSYIIIGYLSVNIAISPLPWAF